MDPSPRSRVARRLRGDAAVRSRVVFASLLLTSGCLAPESESRAPEQEGPPPALLGARPLHTGRVLYWGSVRFVTCASAWSCEAPADVCTVTCDDGRSLKPLMYCDGTCINALQSCDTDDAAFFAAPTPICGQNVTMCWGGHKVRGRVRDRSDRGAWEMSEGVRARLGAPAGTVEGALVLDGDPCGDGVCQGICGETAASCPWDCGGQRGDRAACCAGVSCGASPSPDPSCIGFDCGTCLPDYDCDTGSCTRVLVTVCGDGECRRESCNGCPTDCCPARACVDDAPCAERGAHCDPSTGQCCFSEADCYTP